MENHSISEDSRPDLERLLATLLPFAEKQLRKRGEFTPFAALMNIEMNIELAMSHDDSEETTMPDLIGMLEEGFRARVAENQIRATGICYDGILRLESGGHATDAIIVDLEHECGDTVKIARPYSKKLFRRLVFEDIIALPLEPSLFTL